MGQHRAAEAHGLVEQVAVLVECSRLQYAVGQRQPGGPPLAVPHVCRGHVAGIALIPGSHRHQVAGLVEVVRDLLAARVDLHDGAGS